MDRYHLCFALGKALEDRGEFEPVLRVLQPRQCAQARHERLRSGHIEAGARLQKAVCTGALFARHAGCGAPAPDPIFIVGLPRAGSTLIEQILASHSAVEGTQELADIPRIVTGLQGRDARSDEPPIRACWPMTAADFSRLGEQYLRDTRAYRATGRPRFIDKMPNNFRHIGLIHLILPNARIIDARREPMACCFSNFKQLFAPARHSLMGSRTSRGTTAPTSSSCAHWDEVLPGRVLRVHYEDVVDDLEGSVRRLLDYCGLELEPACLEFHQTERSVRTPSSEQVRQPIYRDGLEQWRHYEQWLGPLREALGRCG